MVEPRTTLRRAATQARVTAHAVHHLGLPTVGLILANSARRRLQGRPDSAARSDAAAVSPGRLERVEVWNPRPGTALFHFERASLEVAFLATDVVRVSWGPGLAPVPYAIAGDVSGPAPLVQAHPIDVLRSDGAWVLRSEALEITVSPHGALRTARSDGTLLRTESAPARRGSAWEQSFSMREGERFCGLGEQAAGIDLRGAAITLWNTDPGGSWGPGKNPLYLGIPVLVSTHPDGDLLTFYENSTHATFGLEGRDPQSPVETADTEQSATVRFAGGVLRRYLVAGPVPHLLDRYTELTGRPALPPRWALGYHQSRWGYKCEADVRAITDGFADLGIPLSAVHLDIDYMRGFRVFTVDVDRFPDLRRLTGDAAVTGARVVTIVDAGVKVDPDYDVFCEGRDHHHFCTDPHGHLAEGVVWPGRSVFPDFTDPGTRAWWARKYRLLTDAGVAGIWHDMNEPTSIALLGDPTLPTSTRHHFDGRGGDHAEGHNLYGMLMNRAGYEGLRDADGDARPFIVSRSGWAGMQRWAWNWTGDVASTWESMRQQVATVVGLGLSGVPYSGSDIGGFSGVPDDELYLRWLQMSVFMPYCRTHSVRGVPPREPWCFSEPTRTALAGWIRFRYRILPYLYTLAHLASETGAPLIRPLWWPGPSGEVEGATGGVDVDDAFLLGDALLVAPVTEPGARRRAVALPPGSWTSLWNDDRADGAHLEAPLERLPVLARAGSIVPFDDGWADPGGPCPLAGDAGIGPARRALALDHAPHLLAFHCWPDGQGGAEGVCIDDAGDGDGPARRDALRVEGACSGGSATWTWDRSGDFSSPDLVRVVLHGLTAQRAVADGTEVPVSGSVVVVDCPPFSELTLEGLRPTHPLGV
ncbi:MAG: TIM-barrel domain-containing protein [Acidimicrobiales bacterium]